MNVINKFFGTILGFFDQITGHYLLALLIFALLVKIIMLPFGIKQQKTSIKQAHVRPREMAIRAKYKGRTDQPTQQKMQQEVRNRGRNFPEIIFFSEFYFWRMKKNNLSV